MTYGVPSQKIEYRWRKACFKYLQLLLDGAPIIEIRAAAADVLKYAKMFGGPRGTVQ